jgi:polar amino acid transport system substrate-binding protein
MRAVGAVAVIGILSLSAVAATAADLRFISIDAAPWGWIDAGGGPRGVFPALVAELEARTGHRIDVAIRAFPRIDRDLESGDRDCTVVLWNEKRARIVEKGEDVLVFPFGVIARRGLRLERYEDLHGLVISVTRDLTVDPRFDADPALGKEFDKDYRAGLEKMARGRVDAIAGVIPTIRYIARRNGLGDQIGQALQLRTVPIALQCARGSAHVGRMGELGAAIRAMRADGTVERIMAEHYGD